MPTMTNFAQSYVVIFLRESLQHPFPRLCREISDEESLARCGGFRILLEKNLQDFDGQVIRKLGGKVNVLSESVRVFKVSETIRSITECSWMTNMERTRNRRAKIIVTEEREKSACISIFKYIIFQNNSSSEDTSTIIIVLYAIA